jgi:UDP-N-acetylmuramoyl-L-alanyl-D-glutamate--2,6-diaminopimelate ligase
VERRGASLGDVAHRIEERVGPVQMMGDAATGIVGVRFDDRTVQRPSREQLADVPVRGDLFCCLPGAHRDGHDFAPAAREAGAVAFLCERDLGDAAGGAAQLIVGAGHAREAMAHAACLVAGDPSTKLLTIGVTGTNGKTTTTYLLCSILWQAGYAPGLVGTLSGARTTPEAPDLQDRLELFGILAEGERRRGAVALEVTSHALVQHRVDGFVHDVAVFTNLSQDHLDYHGTMEAYFEAKTLLFTPDHARRAVVNVGDEHGRRLAERAEIPTEGFSIDDADKLELRADGSRFVLRGHEVALPLVGRFNIENALAAAAAARAAGIGDEAIAEGLSTAHPVPGRLELVPNALGLTAVVDYAHTPAGLEQACTTLKQIRAGDGRLVIVFGAGGDRDHEKRRPMGHAASSHADLAVVTTDNPRHEDPNAIIDEIVAGCDGGAEVHVEPDRRAAIGLGLSLADRGDVVLVAGKGHETTQQIGDEYLEFDDRVVIAEEAERLAGAA